MQWWSILKVEKNILVCDLQRCKCENTAVESYEILSQQPNVGSVMRLRTVDPTCMILF